ncbi:hypothetical protein [Rhodococcus sp. AH-ZY2]|uniref:hypothetical protein n=1 Tax=Rhodococcus sp. AH-ZY2 TaxID=3047468 RepID=UPI0027DEBD4E|nr:hypothetical protein [Rhodococcus sp. AH-ZY2]WML61915.1 hypothetical protein QNA09_18945 [Rhodococcus sp. AH-ZY2]
MDNLIDATVAYNLTRQTARHIGYELPTELVDTMTRLDTLAAARFPEPDRDALGEALAAAVLDNRDPLDDTTITRHLMAGVLKDSRYGTLLNDHAKRGRATALTNAVPALVKTWKKIVTDADNTLAAAREQVPNLDVTDTNTTHNARAWGQAREAAATLEQITQAWTMVMTATRHARTEPRTQLLIVADLTAEQLDQLGPHATIHTAVNAGHRFTLADADTYRHRCEQVQAQRDEQKRRAALALEHRTKGRSLGIANT